MKLLEVDKRNLERQLTSMRPGNVRSKSYERPEKAHIELLGSNTTIESLEQENRELRLKIRRLETQLAEKEAELMRIKSLNIHSHSSLELSRGRTSELERLRAAQLQAEKLLEAREQSHRQQVLRLENQVNYFTVYVVSSINTIHKDAGKRGNLQNVFLHFLLVRYFYYRFSCSEIN